jgi:hypothetical protein
MEKIEKERVLDWAREYQTRLARQGELSASENHDTDVITLRVRLRDGTSRRLRVSEEQVNFDRPLVERRIEVLMRSLPPAQ